MADVHLCPTQNRHSSRFQLPGTLLLLAAVIIFYITRREVQGRPVFQPIIRRRPQGIDMTTVTSAAVSEVGKADKV